MRNGRGIALYGCRLQREMALQVVRTARLIERCLARNPSCTDQLRQGLFHGRPALGFCGFNMRAQLMVIAAANEIANCVGSEQDFVSGVAAAPRRCQYKLLRDDQLLRVLKERDTTG